MQDSPALGRIDLFPGEHGFDLFRQASLARQVEQQVHGRIHDTVLGIIKKDAALRQGEAIETPGVASEQVPHMQAADFLLVMQQRLPGG